MGKGKKVVGCEVGVDIRRESGEEVNVMDVVVRIEDRVI